ncbi:MAG: hypothetical protein H0Z33_13445 [Bacillaceae bacterium]|nr:hypothetical protein [Bacillaceae bacterium]
MSVSTGVISLELICAVHKTSDLSLTFQQLVHKLQSQVAYFDWVAIYLYDRERESYELTASAGEIDPSPLYKKNIMQIPMYGSDREILGKITVISSGSVSFDETDYHSLKTLARELSKKLI